MIKRPLNEQGSTMIAATLICVLVTAAVMTSMGLSRLRVVEGVHTMGRQQSQFTAESAVEDVMRRLRDPDLGSWLPINSTHSIKMAGDKGGFEINLSRKNFDPSLVDVEAAGFSYGEKAGSVAPTGQKAYRSVVKAVLRVLNSTEFLCVTPGSLDIAYGSNIPNGRVYAGRLTFRRYVSGPVNPTQIREAFYHESVQDDQTGDVVFTHAPDHAQRVLTPLRFARLDSNTRAVYYAKATGVDSHASQLLPAGSTFSGLRAAPPGGAPNVYYCDGDLHLGASGLPLTVSGTYVIYVTQTAFIDNPILLNDTNSWVAILAERNIEVTTLAPNHMQLKGNYYTNGRLLAHLPPRPTGTASSFNLEGGMVSPRGVMIGEVWTVNRTYNHRLPPPDSKIYLPNLALQLEYRVTEAQYDR